MNKRTLRLSICLVAILATWVDYALAGTAPTIIQQPVSIMVPLGGVLRLSCQVTGAEPLSVIWQKDGTFMGAQTNQVLMLTNAQGSDSGQYRLLAANEDGVVRSDVAEVVVFTNQACNFPWVWAYTHACRTDLFPCGSIAYDATFDGTGHLYVTGEDQSDYITMKFDGAGRVVWDASYSGPIPGSSADRAVALALDSSGNCFVTGWSQRPNASESDSPTPDYWTIKYGVGGNELWSAGFNSSTNRTIENNYSSDWASKIEVDSLGNAYVSGSPSLLKYSSDGVPQWTNRFRGDSLQLTKDESALYMASFEVNQLVRIDAVNGGTLWSAPVPIMTSGLGHKMVVDGAGGVCVTGIRDYNRGPNPRGDIEMVKFDAAGNRVWTAIYDGPSHGLDYPTAMATDVEGNTFVAGYSWTLNQSQVNESDYTGFDMLTLKYDREGHLLWARTHGRSGLYDSATDVAVDAAGAAYVCGTVTQTNKSQEDREGVIIKYDPAGNELWRSQYGTRGVDDIYFTRIILGPSNTLAACGSAFLGNGNERRMALLVLYFDQSTPRVAVAGVPAPGVRQGCLVSPRGSQFEIQATTNHMDWESLGSVTNWNGLVPFYDRDAGKHPARFYRAKSMQP